MKPFVAPGPSMEIGSGSGNFKSLWSGLMSSDMVYTPFVDVVADGLRLPIASRSLGNLVAIDLLHHLSEPHECFEEAARVLRPGGRILAIEPYITPISWLGYRFLHDEDVWFGGYHRSGGDKDPWEDNQAIGNLIFAREGKEWPQRHPTLRFIHKQRFSLLDFQLAGGLKPYALIGRQALYDLFLGLDRWLDRMG